MLRQSHTHPGEVLLKEFMVPSGLTSAELAFALSVPEKEIADLANGRGYITGTLAQKLSGHFGNSAVFWNNLQNQYARPKTKSDGVPARADVRFYTPAEEAIAAAVQAVENCGGSPALTDAVNILQKAQERVADHMEGEGATIVSIVDTDAEQTANRLRDSL
jgi:addiction module HigA family antidote